MGNIMAEGRTMVRVLPQDMPFARALLTRAALAVSRLGGGRRDTPPPRLRKPL